MSAARAIELSYGEMTTLLSGAIMSKEEKIGLRKQFGYCLTCPLVPVQIHQAQKSRVNPFWFTKKPLSVEGESSNGKCLKCQPALDLLQRQRHALSSFPSTQSFLSGSSDSQPSPDRHRQNATGSRPHGSQSLDNRNVWESQGSSNSTPRRRRSSMSGSQASLHPEGPVGVHGSARRRNSLDTSFSTDVSSENHPAGTIGQCGSNLVTREVHTRRNASPVSRGHARPRRGGRHPNRAMEMANSECGVRRLPQRLLCYSNGSSVSELGDEISTFYQPNLEPTHDIEKSDESEKEMLKEITKTLTEVVSTKCGELIAECLHMTMKTHRANEDIQLICLEEIVDGIKDGYLDQQLFIAEIGVLQVLEAMQDFPAMLSIQRTGSRALGVLATGEGTKSVLVRRGACCCLLVALERFMDDVGLVTSVLATLRILSTSTERTNIQNISSITVKAMTYHMSSPLIQRDGCAILSNMAVDSDLKVVATVSSDEIRVIATAIQQHSHDEAVVASGCFALKNFSFDDINVRNMSRIADIIQIMQCAQQFPSIYCNSSKTLERLYIVIATDESLNERSHDDLELNKVELPHYL